MIYEDFLSDAIRILECFISNREKLLKRSDFEKKPKKSNLVLSVSKCPKKCTTVKT